MTNAVKPKSLIHIVMCRPSLILIYIFYRVKWIDKPQDKGFYLIKRYWVWYLLIPIMLIAALLQAIYITVKDIHSYNMHWISGEKHKLNFKQKLLYGDRLFH
jgi:hypothetical protein